MPGNPSESFYQVQKRQRWKSLLVFPLVLGLYFLTIALVVVPAGMLLGPPEGGYPFIKTLALSFGIAFVIAAFHFWNSRENGAREIASMLSAGPSRASDRYHRQFNNIVEEMRIVSGLPQVDTYVYASSEINSMAIVQSRGTPAIFVSEGLLAACTRDEVQAVVAHELSHVMRGDAVYVTLVCSLGNFFESIKESLRRK